MNEQSTFLSRIGRLFKRTNRPNGDALTHDLNDPVNLSDDPAGGSTALATDESGEGGAAGSGLSSNLGDLRPPEPRNSTLLPWRNNSAAISRLQEGFASLTDLMGSIRDHMEAQGKRQDELISHLSTLPKVLELIPESARVQSETLQAIKDQLLHQSDQQKTLGEILGQMGESGGDQREILDTLRQRVESLGEQDKAMAGSLNNVSAAMESVSKNASASTSVLGQLRENLQSRDSDLERVLHRQGSRFTAMLAIAIFLSISALAAVCVMFYMMMHSQH